MYARIGDNDSDPESFKLARADYLESIRLVPKNAWAHWNLAYVYEKMGDAERGGAERKEAKAIDPAVGK